MARAEVTGRGEGVTPRRELSAISDQEAREKQIPLPPLRDRDDEEGRQERPKNRSEDRPLHQKGRSGMGGVAIDRRKERSLHSAARRATIRHERKNRAAPVGMTAEERGGTGSGSSDRKGEGAWGGFVLFSFPSPDGLG